MDDGRRAVPEEGREPRSRWDRRLGHATAVRTGDRMTRVMTARMRVAVLAAASVACAATLSAQGRGGGGGGGRGTAIPPGESCPPGQTEIRPRSCMAPEGTPPSILDYRPRSTLIAPTHMVPTAKYPAIDFHGHPGQLIASAKGLDSLKRSL